MTLPERDLEKLLAGIDPHLNDGQWVFCAAEIDGALMTFRESEGPTSIVRREAADAGGHRYTLVAAWITLRVHSDLEAVGFLARISNDLAAADISCNVVSAFHHDHLFVPWDRRHDAMKILAHVRSRTAHR